MSVEKEASTDIRKIYQSDEVAELRRRTTEAQSVYGRGRKVSVKGVKDKKLRGNLRRLESKYKDATLKAKDAEILLENEAGFLEAEGELERTYKVRQDELKQELAVETARKGFELKLIELGPYVAEYSRNGRHLILAGRKGHVSTIDWRAGELGCELQLGETIRDAKWLHNNQYFAVSQKKYVYIYDSAGVELHCLRKHIEVTNMEFLPYHFLLASVVGFSFELGNGRDYKLIKAGECRIFKIHRHINWADGDRDAYTTRVPNSSGSESI